MRKLFLSGLITILFCSSAHAQPAGVSMEMIMRALPLEGAPLAEAGPYQVVSEGAFNAARYIVFHPAELTAFPAQDTLPVMLWGNGGCAIDGTRYSEFLSTIASHGFLVMTTTAIEGEEQRQQTAEDLLAAISWAESENVRSGSPLNGKIDITQIAVMGQSCGGFLSITLGTDPKVSTIGVFNSGIEDTAALSELHGPVMFINGHEVDFMMDVSHSNYAQINQLPAFYGARHNAGHTATVYHPGGGEFANVASNWLRYHFKGDAAAGRMFVGDNCELCSNTNWETESKGL